MKIIQFSVNIETDRMYCPSTDETIFAPDFDEINESAEAFIAYWHDEVLDEPSITNSELESAWNEFYEKWDDLTEDLYPCEAVEKFLSEYENPQWVVYECLYSGMACGPVSNTVYYVVNAETIIDEVDFDEVDED